MVILSYQTESINRHGDLQMKDLKKMARIAIRKMRSQVTDSPEARLMFAVTETAILDLCLEEDVVNYKGNKKNKSFTARSREYQSSLDYFNSEHCFISASGLDCSYVKRILRSVGFDMINE